MGHRLGGALKPAGDAAQGAVVQRDRRAAQANVFHRRVVPDARQHGVQRKAHKHGNQHRHHNGQAKLVEKLADDAAHKTNGQKHRHDGQGGGQHRQANLLRAVQRGLERRFAHLHVAHDVFAHHNGVVNQQAHAQAQRHHGDHVQGKTQHVHEQKRADDGNGQRQPRNHGRAPRVQEQENNQHGEQRAFDQRAGDVVDRHPDGARTVGNGRELDAGRQLLLQLGQRFLQPVHHRNRVFVLCFLHRDHERALAVVQRQAVNLLRAVAHLR